MILRGCFALSDLALLTFVPADDLDGDPDHYEDVLDEAGQLASDDPASPDPDFCATDTDIGRGPWGWSALVMRAEVPGWTEAAKRHGYTVELEDAGAGHYGDGHWRGVDLAERIGSTTEVYWIDLEASA